MTEKLNESQESGEKLDLAERASENLDKLKTKAESAKEFSDNDLENIRHNIETKAISGKEISLGEKHKTEPSHSFAAHKQLKVDAYKRGLKNIQNRLSKPDRFLSKIIHQDKVETVSNIAGQTIARPSGILAGGLFALIGSSVVLYASRHYGFRYNFSIFVLLLVGGYFLGLLVELAVGVIKRR